MTDHEPPPTVGAMRTLRFAALTLVAASIMVAAAGCDLRYNRLDDGFTKPDRVTEVQIQPGSGNVRVRADDSVTGVDVRRSVRYRGSDTPSESARIEGSTLTLNMDCGNHCSVSYDVRLPRGVNVRGSNYSGNIELDGVGLVEVKVGSGIVDVDGVSGAAVLDADSGNIVFRRVAGTVAARTDSGNIEGHDVTGPKIRVAADSGNIDLDYAGTGSLDALTDSGNITVKVPDGACRVSADADSGQTKVGVATISSGTCTVTAHADSGNITISPR